MALIPSREHREPTVPRTAVARALRRAGRSGCRFPLCGIRQGSSALLGVAAGRFDGLAQGKKRAQAESGTAAEVLVWM